MSARDELLARLTAERFTKHQRVTEWHGDAPETEREAWKRLKELRESTDLSPACAQPESTYPQALGVIHTVVPAGSVTSSDNRAPIEPTNEKGAVV